MKSISRLRIAIQKSGRLNHDSLDLLYRCGLKMHTRANTLFCHSENLPIDILFVRDDDIPTLVMDDICDLGIVGENVLFEKIPASRCAIDNPKFTIVQKLGFSRCRLSIALPEEIPFSPKTLQGLKIATSYPNLLQQYLDQHQIKAEITVISGSVEITPRLGMADAICDLVATGQTLEEHNLKEVAEIIQSQAVLIKTQKDLNPQKLDTFELLLRRINGVLKAQESKYIMFHAPLAQLDKIKNILPGAEMPTIIPLAGTTEKVAVHAVSTEGVFWSTLEKLQEAGASSILVLPIEKMLN
ncbi:MAG TPA: ATP phosphoribosyltransferase [Gammaproteobacteria bacterium]|nr:ATP phosphoribosyltransferase [Gammaproteobacteria bacterium]